MLFGVSEEELEVGKEKRRKVRAMKLRKILIIAGDIVSCIACFVLSGCASAERKVRVFDVNGGGVLEIRNAASGFTREIAEASPGQAGHSFSTLQNALCCGEKGRDRSIIRVYDTNATLQCTSFVPFPDGIYLSPREFSVCSGKIIFWNCRFNAKAGRWEDANELCIATLSDKRSIGDSKRISMPAECGTSVEWDQSFMWSSPTSVVANVRCQDRTKRIAIVDTASGNFRFLPLDIRLTLLLPSSFQGSLSRRYFSIVSSNGEVAVCDGQGNVCNVFSVGQLREFGLREPPDSDMWEGSCNEMLTMSWDDGDVLWVFNANGKYVGIDAETNSVIKKGCVSLGCGEELIGLVQGRRAVIKQKRTSEIVRSIWGNHFYVKDIETGSCVVELPNYISKYVYLGNGLMLLEDL